ncbi:xanthine dehydrogenase accessory protein XdhC [Microlunatus soli]|uniref:Molybdenum cofactor sulfurylase n=1 Tax=Microlunatus soli TaxID=630515 RepID=A0A1H1X565_9ACTN|nr:xanthine dehydrogenase accessory protein XdhC [Microlunatus soli]SDT03709.1 molybdenum cofactor sulfurylase [Microlunatus soli]
MTWLSDVAKARERRQPAVLVTQIARRGHAPREAGAKMLVTADDVRGTIGGGNLEQTAVVRARELIRDRAATPELLGLRLNDKVRTEHGRQCCGGEVTILLEPLPVPLAIAIFGLGHVGIELARILSRQDCDLYLTDSRPEQLDQLDMLQPAEATIHARQRLLGEQVLSELPADSHVLIMTHDHAEDAHLCDAALRRTDLASIGMIGSVAKWSRIRSALIADGHPPALVETIRCPIGLTELPGKSPAMIAVSVAAELLLQTQQQETTS